MNPVSIIILFCDSIVLIYKIGRNYVLWDSNEVLKSIKKLVKCDIYD